VEGTNTGHEDGEAMASVGVSLTVMLGPDISLYIATPLTVCSITYLLSCRIEA
jgi:hypothetical protein